MIVTLVGGGSTFTPGIVKSVLLRQHDFPVKEVRLYDIDKERQDKVGVIVDFIIKELNLDTKLTVTNDPKEAFTDVDFVFAQMRVGKYAMREQDEKIPLKYEAVGQETCGTGGLAYGLRTIFPMIEVMDWVKEYAKPNHWILNYSNPAAVMAEACRVLRPDARIINICDMPIAILDQIGSCLKVKPSDIDYDYFGLNHYGWFTRLSIGERDILKEAKEYVLSHGTLLSEEIIERVNKATAVGIRHNDNSWLKTWGNMSDMLQLMPEYFPNSYNQYYTLAGKVVSQSNPERTRANEVMDGREGNLFKGVDKYLETGEMDKDTFYHGSHGNFIVDLAVSLSNDEGRKFLVIVENKGAISNLPDDAMVEVPAYITSQGPQVVRRGHIPIFYKGLLEQQLASEKLLVEGAIAGSYQKVLEAFIMNKTIKSADQAKNILDEMIVANKEFWPELK